MATSGGWPPGRNAHNSILKNHLGFLRNQPTFSKCFGILRHSFAISQNCSKFFEIPSNFFKISGIHQNSFGNASKFSEIPLKSFENSQNCLGFFEIPSEFFEIPLRGVEAGLMSGHGSLACTPTIDPPSGGQDLGNGKKPLSTPPPVDSMSSRPW